MRERHSFLVRMQPRWRQRTASHGRTALITDPEGLINPGTEQGLYYCETRLLSRWECHIEGQRPTPVVLSNIEQHSSLGYYIVLPPGFDPGPPDQGSGQVAAQSQNSLELRVSRFVGEGQHEDIDLENFTQQATAFRLEIFLEADFASTAEAGHKHRTQRGKLRRTWRPAADGGELSFDYLAKHRYHAQQEQGTAVFHRGVRIIVHRSGSPPMFRRNRLIFQIDLPPHAKWHTCIEVQPVMEDGRIIEPVHGCRSLSKPDNELERRRQLFLSEATHFSPEPSHPLTPVVLGALEQAVRDLASLRLYDLDSDPRAWTVAAGVPIYIALFGRDTLSVGWQAAIISPDIMRGTLPILAKLQGTTEDDWRDEQPGRMLHEAHTDPLSILNFNPRERYYGGVTTSIFYSVVVSLLWHWTGDKSLVLPYIEPALRGLRWLEKYGDTNNDGFYDYFSRSNRGTQNQGWKDSGDAIVYEDGRQVAPSIAMCEEQGFTYAAKQQLSAALWWLDRKDEAYKLYHQAEEFKKRFNEAYWMDDKGYFAMGLDSHSRQIKSIGSDPGHCLATGIADKSLVERTASRMFAEDLFSGWGIRTLSADHPAYNPYSYHRGSVWPVEQGAFTLGFVRFGLHDLMEKLCRAQFEAASLFDFYRLPEVFSGHERDEDHPFPAIYPNANSPQAWSASANFSFLQAMLGLFPYAPLHILIVDPHLPEWLPEITLTGLRVGQAVTKIRFYRQEDGASSYEVLDLRGKLHVVRQPSPWSLTSTFAERAKDLLTSLLPGK